MLRFALTTFIAVAHANRVIEEADDAVKIPGLFDSLAPDYRSPEHTDASYDPRDPKFWNMRDPRSHSHHQTEDIRDYGHQVVIDPRDKSHIYTPVGMAATTITDSRDPMHQWTPTGPAHDKIVDPRDPMQYTDRSVVDPRDPMQYSPRDVVDPRDPIHITAPAFKKKRFVDIRDPMHYEPPKHQSWQPIFNSTWDQVDSTKEGDEEPAFVGRLHRSYSKSRKSLRDVQVVGSLSDRSLKVVDF
jgi:rhodanese-related sulfurtransferase